MVSFSIPDLSDKELENLQGNAVRLARFGAGAQRAEAEDLLPVIGREVEMRVQARAAAAREKLAIANEQRRAKSRTRKAALRAKADARAGVRAGRKQAE
jgi:hypothetical protein